MDLGAEGDCFEFGGNMNESVVFWGHCGGPGRRAPPQRRPGNKDDHGGTLPAEPDLDRRAPLQYAFPETRSSCPAARARSPQAQPLGVPAGKADRAGTGVRLPETREVKLGLQGEAVRQDPHLGKFKKLTERKTV